jgi:hypothetical protein
MREPVVGLLLRQGHDAVRCEMLQLGHCVYQRQSGPVRVPSRDDAVRQWHQPAMLPGRPSVHDRVPAGVLTDDVGSLHELHVDDDLDLDVDVDHDVPIRRHHLRVPVRVLRRFLFQQWLLRLPSELGALRSR